MIRTENTRTGLTPLKQTVFLVEKHRQRMESTDQTNFDCFLLFNSQSRFSAVVHDLYYIFYYISLFITTIIFYRFDIVYIY